MMEMDGVKQEQTFDIKNHQFESLVIKNLDFFVFLLRLVFKMMMIMSV